MNKNSLALLIALTVFNSSYCLLGDGSAAPQECKIQYGLNAEEAKLFALYQKDYEQASEDERNLMMGNSHTNICFGGAVAGALIYASSYLINDTQKSAKIAGLGRSIFFASGAIGVVAIGKEQLNIHRCHTRKQELRTQFTELGKR